MIALAFLHKGVQQLIFRKWNISKTWAANPRIVFFEDSLLELKNPANNGNKPGDPDRWVEMSPRVQKGGFIIEKL